MVDASAQPDAVISVQALRVFGMGRLLRDSSGDL